jgi:transposase
MRAAGDRTPTLPEDSAALRALLLETMAQVDTLVAERDALASQNEQLQHLLLKLKRRQFGTKSERPPEDQLLFAFEEIEATLAGNAAEAGKASPTLRDGQAKRRRAGRGRLPAHLPRVEMVLAPETTACPCCAGPTDRDRRRRRGAARRDPGAVPRHRHEAGRSWPAGPAPGWSYRRLRRPA